MPGLVRAAAGVAGVIFCVAAITSTNPFAGWIGILGAFLIVAAIGRAPRTNDTEGN